MKSLGRSRSVLQARGLGADPHLCSKGSVRVQPVCETGLRRALFWCPVEAWGWWWTGSGALRSHLGNRGVAHSHGRRLPAYSLPGTCHFCRFSCVDERKQGAAVGQSLRGFILLLCYLAILFSPLALSRTCCWSSSR